MTVQNWLKLEPGIFTFATRIVYTNSPQYSGKQGQEIQILNTFLIKVRSAGKCHVWCHKNTSKKERWEVKWERKPLKKMDNRCIFMTSHNHMTLSSASKVNFAQKSFFSSFNYHWCLIMNREYFVKFQLLTTFFYFYI